MTRLISFVFVGLEANLQNSPANNAEKVYILLLERNFTFCRHTKKIKKNMRSKLDLKEVC